MNNRENMFYNHSNTWRKIYINFPKTFNHVHKYGKGLLPVIVMLGKNVSEMDIAFYYGVRLNGLVKRDHFINNLYGRFVVGSF